MPSKGATEIVHLGDRVLLQPAGSGGYGDPKERAVTSIEADLLDGYITLEAARTLYGYQGSIE
jgi:N-methylhydantoinase B